MNQQLMKQGAEVMMKFFKLRILTTCTILIFAILFPPVLRSQTRSYTAENLNYVLVLPSSNWRAVNVSGINNGRTEFRYDDHGTVHLRVRRELVHADVTITDLIQDQQRLDRSFLLGYVKEKIEPFAGHLSGARYAYEYVRHGKSTARVIYYLEANNHMIYRLEFEGSRDLLSKLADQTDFIARSFRLK